MPFAKIGVEAFRIRQALRAVMKMKHDKILLDHGSGGKIWHRMTKDMLLPAFNNPILAELNDGAIFELGGLRMAFSTDSYTVDPIFFPGGTLASWRFTGR